MLSMMQVDDSDSDSPTSNLRPTVLSLLAGLNHHLTVSAQQKGRAESAITTLCMHTGSGHVMTCDHAIHRWFCVTTPTCQDSNQQKPPRGFEHVLQYEITAMPLPLTACSCAAAALDASKPRAAQPCIDPTGLAAVFGIATANIQPGTRHHMMASPPASAAGMLASASAMAPSAPGSAATHSHCNLHTSSTFSNLGLSADCVDVWWFQLLPCRPLRSRQRLRLRCIACAL